ncbi:MAG TPA: hypothetical protein VKV80_06450 [Streptosporangiaceae bacterium]|nr:hypothetical protein [Streptosporangiaceae bacterium]
MADKQVSQPGFQVSTGQVIGGAVLIGVGGLLVLTGTAMAGTAVVTAFRRRVQQMDVPPSELARQNWARVKAATAAGVSGWRNGQPAAGYQRR